MRAKQCWKNGVHGSGLRCDRERALDLKGEEKNIRFDHQDRETSAKWLDLNIKLNNLLIAYLGTENIANARCLLYHLDHSVN